MRFIVSRFYTPKSVTLEYLVYEYSFCGNWGFDWGNLSRVVDYEVSINYLTLRSYYRKVGFFDLAGYSPYIGWIPRRLHIPLGEKKDILPKNDSLGDIIGEKLPYFYDKTTNWICCGDPEQKGRVVHFTEQMAVSLNDQGKLTALWLKPVFISPESMVDEFSSATGTDKSKIVIAQ